MDYVVPRTPAADSVSFVHISKSSLQLTFVRFHGHADQLVARAHTGFLEQALEDGFAYAMLAVKAPAIAETVMRRDCECARKRSKRVMVSAFVTSGCCQLSRSC